MALDIIVADYNNPEHCLALVSLLNSYACDPMGGGEAIAPSVLETLPSKLAKRRDAISLIAYVDGHAVGLLNAFEGFSTFKAKPLLNIHDIAVEPPYRGQGIGQQLLAKAEQCARERGCCKLTLEVLEGNLAAQQSYTKFGFAGYELNPQMGKALFWQKDLV
ncbi:GNAT family N-acetyltransferase [Gallaecimonas mangrovi]|uniref:GNAT family N-acetyltransferase n=1 Tax=Gallaecimonas mangrovi TaxID=2291597 RepID=UPI000E203F33|nr:GNAT family N-acetyltransferase [Gallaecimonas mangrovi]